MRLFVLVALLLPSAAMADVLVAVRTIRSQSILAPGDLAVLAGDAPGSLSHPSEAEGMEARVVLYAGRPIRPADIGPAALIERNQMVTLVFHRGALAIKAEGRSLARGGVGDVIKVMNLASRSTVSGVVGADGIIRVPGGDPTITGG